MHTVAISIQKGGVGKTTTTLALTHLLAKNGYKVLVIDMDGSQCNTTMALLEIDDPNELGEKAVHSAIKTGDARPYILKTKNDNIDILAGSQFVSAMNKYFYIDKRGKYHTLLKDALKSVEHHYDFCLIDTLPSLSEPMLMSLFMTDSVLIPFDCSKFTLTSLHSFLETVDAVKEFHDIKNIMVLRCLIDARRSDMQFYADEVQKLYPKLTMKTIIRRNASAGRLSSFGIFDNREIKKVEKFFQPLLRELILRIKLTT